MKLLSSLLLAILVPTAILGQTFSYINNGNESENHHPFYGLYDYSHNMYIYDQADIGDGEKEIFELSFDLSSYGQDYTYYDLTIKLAHTTDDEFRSNARVNLNNIEHRGVTVCVSDYDLEIDSDGFVTIPFTTSFNYNGIDNLLVIVENHDGDWTMGFGASKGMYTPNYKSWYKYTDNSYPSGTGTRQRFLPNIGLGYFTFNPLPIELFSFEGDSDDEIVTLHWQTASENNNNYFTIWRSFDGLKWDAIAQIQGASYSTTLQNYGFKDMDRKYFNPQLEQVYYKLSQTDFDGTSEIFNPISISLDTAQRVLLKTVNLMGYEIDSNEKGFALEVWSDGNNVKRIRQ